MTTGERYLEVFLDHNNKCNLKCLMCGFSDPRVGALPKFDMPFELFEAIVREVLPHASYLALSCMTEPLMTRDFPERLRLLPAVAVPFIEVITNAMLLTDRIIEEILAVPLARLTVSIDGATKETYERIRVGANFEKVVNNVRRFSELKRQRGAALPLLRINHVLTESNLDEFPLFLALAESLTPDAIDVRTVVQMSNSVIGESHEETFFGRVRSARMLLEHWCARTGVLNEGYLRHTSDPIDLFMPDGHKRTCERPWNTVAIHANGDVLPCISWTRSPVGNLAAQSFDEIWNGPRLRALREEFTAKKPGIDCQHCTIKKDVEPETHDDFFFRMIAKSAPPALRR